MLHIIKSKKSGQYNKSYSHLVHIYLTLLTSHPPAHLPPICYWSKVPVSNALKNKLKTSVFGVRRGLLVEKAPTETMGDFLVPQIDLKKVWGSGFFYVKGKGNGRDKM